MAKTIKATTKKTPPAPAKKTAPKERKAGSTSAPKGIPQKAWDNLPQAEKERLTDQRAQAEQAPQPPELSGEAGGIVPSEPDDAA